MTTQILGFMIQNIPSSNTVDDKTKKELEIASNYVKKNEFELALDIYLAVASDKHQVAIDAIFTIIKNSPYVPNIIEQLKKASDNQSKSATAILAEIYSHGSEYGVWKNKEQANHYLALAKENGYVLENEQLRT